MRPASGFLRKGRERDCGSLLGVRSSSIAEYLLRFARTTPSFSRILRSLFMWVPKNVPASLSAIIQPPSFKDGREVGGYIRGRGRYVPLVKIKLKLAVNIHNTEPRSDFAGTWPPYLFPPLQNRSGSILPRFNYAIARELSTLLDSSRRTIKYSG